MLISWQSEHINGCEGAGGWGLCYNDVLVPFDGYMIKGAWVVYFLWLIGSKECSTALTDCLTWYKNLDV